jgi:Flp pilus assembly protein TadD
MLPLERATMTFPVDDRAYELLAEAAARLGRFAQAREALARAIALEGEPDLARDGWQRAERLGDWSMALHEPQEAALWYDRAVRLRPDDAGLVARLVRAHIDTQRDDAATAALTRFLAAHPATPALLQLQAQLHGPSARAVSAPR